jgi:hypothetical protein
MGTSRTDYVMYGIRIADPKKNGVDADLLYEKYEHLIERWRDESPDPNQVKIVYDGMCGSYVVVGYVLCKGTEECGMQMTQVSVYGDKILEGILKLGEACPYIAETYDRLRSDPKVADIGTWAFTHWS